VNPATALKSGSSTLNLPVNTPHQILPPAPTDANSTNRSECGCLQLKDLLASANLAIADLTEQAYGVETSSSLPIDVCQTCLELLNTAGTVSVSGVSVTGRRLLQTSSVTATTDTASVCPYANVTLSEPLMPSVVAPATTPPTALDDLYYCPFNAACTRNRTLGVLANDTTPNTGGVMNVTGVVTPPPNGTLVQASDGSFTYTPAW
jgi:hypothetical protein